MSETPHEHDATCRPCWEGKHHDCVRVRTYGEGGYCRYICHCTHRPEAKTHDA